MKIIILLFSFFLGLNLIADEGFILRASGDLSEHERVLFEEGREGNLFRLRLIDKVSGEQKVYWPKLVQDPFSLEPLEVYKTGPESGREFKLVLESYDVCEPRAYLSVGDQHFELVDHRPIPESCGRPRPDIF
jgi:hypothetical protein